MTYKSIVLTYTFLHMQAHFLYLIMPVIRVY